MSDPTQVKDKTARGFIQDMLTLHRNGYISLPKSHFNWAHDLLASLPASGATQPIPAPQAEGKDS